MKKNVALSIVISMLFCSLTKAQMFSPGANILNLGIGFGKTWSNTEGSNISLPQLSANFDYGLRDDLGPGIIGIGAIVSYESRSKDDNPYFKWHGTRFIIAPRVSYHLSFNEKFDTYAASAIGIAINKYDNSGDVNSPSYDPKENNVSFIFRASVGARYNFLDNLGAFAEVGYGISVFTFGISLIL